MTQLPGTPSQRSPLGAAEKNRGEVNFAPYVAQALVSAGRFRVSADTPEMVEMFQRVARVRRLRALPAREIGERRDRSAQGEG